MSTESAGCSLCAPTATSSGVTTSDPAQKDPWRHPGVLPRVAPDRRPGKREGPRRVVSPPGSFRGTPAAPLLPYRVPAPVLVPFDQSVSLQPPQGGLHHGLAGPDRLGQAGQRPARVSGQLGQNLVVPVGSRNTGGPRLPGRSSLFSFGPIFQHKACKRIHLGYRGGSARPDHVT